MAVRCKTRVFYLLWRRRGGVWAQVYSCDSSFFWTDSAREPLYIIVINIVLAIRQRTA